MKKSLFLPLLLSICVLGHAQTDTIAVTGTVYNQQTLKPEPYCLVQLLQDSVAKAVRVCDEEGFFFIDSLPAGNYTLRVGVGRVTLFQNDMELREYANLSIYVDTLQAPARQGCQRLPPVELQRPNDRFRPRLRRPLPWRQRRPPIPGRSGKEEVLQPPLVHHPHPRHAAPQSPHSTLRQHRRITEGLKRKATAGHSPGRGFV